MSAEETILNLFDTYWFEHRIFTSKIDIPLSETPVSVDLDTPLSEKPVSVDQQDDEEDNKSNRIRKSHSDQFLSSKDSDSVNSPSPKSVLLGRQLQTILSGKEVEDFQNPPAKQDNTNNCRKKKKKKSGSRSLSELEFEELKGFMDLGFVFSDEIKDSRLVSIVPGLQRLGKNEGEFDGEVSVSVSRPYLSEAWDCLEDDDKSLENSMMDWRIPDFGNEMELKHHLRFWAHSVASTVW